MQVQTIRAQKLRFCFSKERNMLIHRVNSRNDEIIECHLFDLWWVRVIRCSFGACAPLNAIPVEDEMLGFAIVSHVVSQHDNEVWRVTCHWWHRFPIISIMCQTSQNCNKKFERFSRRDSFVASRIVPEARLTITNSWIQKIFETHVLRIQIMAARNQGETWNWVLLAGCSQVRQLAPLDQHALVLIGVNRWVSGSWLRKTAIHARIFPQ